MAVFFVAEAVKPNNDGIFPAVMQYSGNFLAVGVLSFFGGYDLGGGGNTKGMAVNRHVTGNAHQGGNFMAEKLPRTTLKKCTMGNLKEATTPARKKDKKRTNCKQSIRQTKQKRERFGLSKERCPRDASPVSVVFGVDQGQVLVSR